MSGEGSGTEWIRRNFDDGAGVKGVLHKASTSGRAGLALTHGAGGDKDAPLLVALAEEAAARGVATLRCDLPFRQKRPQGPPSPAGGASDRLGLRRAAEALAELGYGPILLGGSSYGARQASILAAEDDRGIDGLLLLSYPLHPPGKPERLRTEHFPDVRVSALFVHGERDAFGSIDEMERALKAFRGRRKLLTIPRATHGLAGRRDGADRVREIAALAADELASFFEL